MWQDNDSAYDTSTIQWWAIVAKEWYAWEILVIQTIVSLEQMTKNAEMKWDKTKGNKNVSIKPLSSSSDIQSLVWGSDRGLEFHKIW